jgi:prepilin-type N-terminal cleavage/methylation domain-containing protein
MNNKGFTLIELIVVTSIIMILTALSLANYDTGKKQLALQRASFKVSQDLRRAQEMSMSSKEFNGSIPLGGYGLFFRKFPIGGYDYPHLYMLFADLDGNSTMDIGSELVEIIDLEKGVKFSDFYLDDIVSNETYFTFIPPDPETSIVDGTYDSTKIIISFEDDATENKTILLNSVGLITIE